MKSTKKIAINNIGVRGVATKIAKNSIYGVMGTATNNESDDLYCSSCLTKMKHWFMDNPLGCYECEDGINGKSKFITLEEVRNIKINNLTDEH